MRITEVSKDEQIHDTEKLDEILTKLCEMIVDGQKEDSEYFGKVAACVLDTDNRAVLRLNYPKDGKRVHAERAAIDAYHKKYGEIPPGSIVITTLSPCSSPVKGRYGSSCTNLIDSLGIKKVYCGYNDPTEIYNNNYEDKNFRVLETSNKKIKQLCKKIADTFVYDC
jgi:pyrimidine deaminase RibD-like protein